MIQICNGLRLGEFAISAGLKIGEHYCSLENKHTGEIYQHHFERPLPDRLYFSPRDYFLKSAKVFGKDVRQALRVFGATGYESYELKANTTIWNFTSTKYQHSKHLIFK